MNQKYKLLLFDLDGTLINSIGDIAQSTNYARNVLGLSPLSSDTIAGFVGSGMTQLLEKAFDTKEKKVIQSALTVFQKHYYDHCLDKTVWYPGVEEGLIKLVSIYPLTILTNKPKEFTSKILEGLGGSSWFKATVSGNESFPKKPDPAGALHLAERFGALPSECLLVGDSDFDIQTAQNAGMDMALATYGFGWEEGGDVNGVPYTLKIFLDLLQFLETDG